MAELRRLRLPLDGHDADLLLVGDRFEEGGAYVQIEIPRDESDGWSPLDWEGTYRRLTEAWRHQFAAPPPRKRRT